MTLKHKILFGMCIISGCLLLFRSKIGSIYSWHLPPSLPLSLYALWLSPLVRIIEISPKDSGTNLVFILNGAQVIPMHTNAIIGGKTLALPILVWEVIRLGLRLPLSALPVSGGHREERNNCMSVKSHTRGSQPVKCSACCDVGMAATFFFFYL